MEGRCKLQVAGNMSDTEAPITSSSKIEDTFLSNAAMVLKMATAQRDCMDKCCICSKDLLQCIKTNPLTGTSVASTSQVTVSMLIPSAMCVRITVGFRVSIPTLHDTCGESR